MKNTFIQEFRYKLLGQDQMSKTLLDKAYINIKVKIETILKKSSLLNIINNKSNNVKSEQILNMTIFTKNHHTFYVFSKSIKDKRLDTAENIY